MNILSRDRQSLLALIDRFPRETVVVLGDLVADEFIHGEISRISREAPVLILKQRGKQIVPGGGANAANNLVDLEARLRVVGIVGEDAAGEALLSYFENKGVSTRWIMRLRGYTTPTKSRVLGGLGHGHMQQIVRIDREPERPLDAAVRRKLSGHAVFSKRPGSAILISDYGYGSTSPAEVAFLRQHLGDAHVPLTVDSRYNLRGYHNVTASTPNEPEMEAAFGERIGDNIRLLHRLASRLLRASRLQALLVTRGREGMALYESGSKPRVLPIFGSDQIADVTGAGDTVIAVFTLALGAGGSFLHAASLANCAGGLVVMKSGTATVTRRELAEAIRNA
ncbi:MAG TPA: PfkB family carbohydrate kinase [Terriglobia bacterium]|nr:PfkB family carbohydrate kinase [Terriglobia bacterium]